MQVTLEQVSTWGCVALLSAIGVWFASAVHHFDKGSPRKPLLLALLALSMATAVATIAAVGMSSRISEWRPLAAAYGDRK